MTSSFLRGRFAHVVVLACVAIGSLAAAGPAAAQSYAITDLDPTHRFTRGSARYVSENGVVAGVVNDAEDREHGFVWTTATGLIDLGANLDAVGMSKGGTAVFAWSGASEPRLAIWTAATGLTDIGRPAWDGTVGGVEVRAVTNEGLIAGRYGELGFVWRADLGFVNPLGGLTATTSSSVSAANSRGDVTGSWFDAESGHGFVWNASSGAVEIPGVGGLGALPAFLNDNGAVSGIMSDGQRYFFWTPQSGTVEVVSPDGTQATVTGMSPTNVVIGYYGNLDPRAFKWTAASGALDLGIAGCSGCGFPAPALINAAGTIAGSINQPGRRAFLWTEPTGMIADTTVARRIGIVQLTTDSRAIGTATLGDEESGQTVTSTVFSWALATGKVVMPGLADNRSEAAAATDSGLIVGRSRAGGVDRPVIWTPQTAPSITFKGFVFPTVNPPFVNLAIGGRNVPVAFSLGTNAGLDIFKDGFPASRAVNCFTGQPIGNLTTIAVPNGTTLTYDKKRNTYAFSWKTDRQWFGCRQLVLTLKDGSSKSAFYFFF